MLFFCFFAIHELQEKCSTLIEGSVNLVYLINLFKSKAFFWLADHVIT